MFKQLQEKKTVYLIRHGEVEAGYMGRFIGSTDAALSETGKSQSISLASRLDIIKPDLCFSSSLMRARETAERAIGDSVSVVYDPDLREVDFGAFECKTFEEIAGLYPDDVDKWNEFARDFSFPGGESIKDFLGRIKAVAEKIEKSACNSIAVFSHGGVIRSLICLWLGLPPEKYIIFNIMPASIAVIDLYGNKGVLSGLDNSCCSEVTPFGFAGGYR